MLKNLRSCHFMNSLKNVGERHFYSLLGRCLRFSPAVVPITVNASFFNSVNMHLSTNVPVCHRVCTKSCLGVEDTVQCQHKKTFHLGQHMGSRNILENCCMSSVHKSAAVPSIPSPHLDQCHPARHGSTSGMSGSKTLTPAVVFSDKNKERIMTQLLSKRKLHRFYTKDIKRRGAVVVPLCSVNGEPCILFTLRTRTLKDHSGEVSFPGGKMDPTDDDVCYTALRELQEELGIEPTSVEVWGNLSPVGRESVTVVPVIGYLGEVDIKRLAYNPDEVAAVFVMTLSHLCSRASQAYTVYEPHAPSGQPVATLPVFVGGVHRVWGLTAYILDQALLAIVPDHYSSLVARVKKEQMALM